MNIVEADNPFNPRAMRGGWKEILRRPQYTHAISLALNAGACPAATVSAKFGRFSLEVDRLVLGRHRVDRMPSQDRIEAIAIAEKLDTNAHLHVVANLGHEFLGRPFSDTDRENFALIWRDITGGGGTLEIAQITDEGWASYITKAANPWDVVFFHSRDFHSRTNVIQCFMTDGAWPFEWSIAA